MSKVPIPFNDRVILKPIDEGESMYGSIIVPDMGKERPEIGEVVQVGPGRVSEFGTAVPVTAQIGDTVIVPKIGTLKIDFEGEEYYIVQDREILAKIPKEEA